MTKEKVYEAVFMIRELKTNDQIKAATGLPHVNVSVIRQLVKIGVL